jgi:hypothetical protein
MTLHHHINNQIKLNLLVTFQIHFLGGGGGSGMLRHSQGNRTHPVAFV